MKQLYILLFFFLGLSLYALAQEEETRTRIVPKPYYPPLPTEPIIDKVSDGSSFPQINAIGNGFGVPTASPEISQRNYLQDIPVNLYTGTPQITIPIYTLQENGLSVPLYLWYNASGIRGGELASSTGLGWNIGGIPTLTRVIRSLPDEGKTEYINGTTYLRKGYLKYGYQIGTQNYTADDDQEPDWYFFSVAGQTYKFTFDRYKTAHFFPENDIKVEAEYVDVFNSITTYFTTFTFTLPDGTKYKFSSLLGPGGTTLYELSCEAEATIANVANFHTTNYYDANKVVSAWPIEKIIAPYGHEITFAYQSKKYSFYKLAENEANVSCPAYNAIVKQINRVFVETAQLSSITGAYTQLLFQSGDNLREDIDDYYSGTPTNQNTAAPKITTIQVKDKNTPSSVISWNLSYGYFSGSNNSGYDLPTGYTYTGSTGVGVSHRKRLKLNQITFPDNSSYTFTYYGDEQGFNFKTRFAYGLDHWGYLNGYDTNINGYGLIGTDVLGSCGATRESSISFMKYGVLTTIKHTAGTETYLDYEAHRANNYQNGTVDLGGLRIKSIRTKDLIRGTDVVKNYDYSNIGSSTGFLIMKPIYRVYNGAGIFPNSGLYNRMLSEVGRAIVGYSKVSETTYDFAQSTFIGKSVWEFAQGNQEATIKMTPEIVPCTFCGEYNPAYLNLRQQSFDGTLLLQKTYNQSNQLLNQIDYQFTTNDGNKYDSTYAVKYHKQYISGGSSSIAIPYYYYFKTYRLISQTATTYSQDGTGTSIAQTTNFTYKDEMPTAYKTTYPGKHQQVVKTSTTDEDNNLIETFAKYSADFDFDVDVSEECDLACIYANTCETDPNCWYYIYTEHVPNPATEARAIYEQKNRNMLYVPIEQISKVNGQVVQASYQSYYPFDSPYNTLPKDNYVLRNVPTTSFSEVVYNKNNGDAMEKDAGYGATRGTILSYNSLGMSLVAEKHFGAKTQANYDNAVGILLKGITSNYAKADALTTLYDYTLPYQGVSKVTQANATELNYTYRSQDARLQAIKDKDGNILKYFEYNTTPGLSSPTLSLSPSLCLSTINAAGCSGTVNWSNGATGSFISVSTANTTSYTATCSANGSTSPASQAVIVPQLPTNWLSADVGTLPVAGCTSYQSATNGLTISGSGTLQNNNDSFHSVYSNQSGDITIMAKVDASSYQILENQGMRSGIMLRASNASNAPYYMLIYDTDAHAIGALVRNYSGDSDHFYGFATVGVDASNPLWIRIKKVGTTYTAWYAKQVATPQWNNDSDWVQLPNNSGDSTVPNPSFASSFLAGFGIYNNSTLNAAVTTSFTNISINGTNF